MKQRIIHPIIAGLLLVLVGIIAILVSGCSTTGGGAGAIGDCATWQKALAIYDATLATGRVPSADETRAAAVARAMIAVTCGQAKLVEPQRTRGLAWPRQPESVTVNGQRYDLAMGFKIIQDPTGVFTRGLETITAGPFYWRVDSDGRGIDAPGCFWMLPLAYERGLTDDLTYMHPITCGPGDASAWQPPHSMPASGFLSDSK